MKAPPRFQDRATEPAKRIFDSVPPPPVVTDREPAEARPSLMLALLCKLMGTLVPVSRGWFFRVRMGVLLTVLVGVLSWSTTDYYQRRARTTWQRPLKVALILVEREPVNMHTIELLTARAHELQRRLASEYRRHDGRDFTPFLFTVTSPVAAHRAPPNARGQDALGLVRDTFARWVWTRDVNLRAGLEPGEYDARIYLVLKPAGQGLLFVEGESEYGGRVGIAQADIALEMVDLSLFVAAHELMHTLGAVDKYDEDGLAIYPAGFAEPERAPLYPQPGAEVMARNRPLSPRSEVPPDTLEQLFVGDETAREIGWRKR